MERPSSTLKEINNKNGPNAMLVKMPELEEAPVNVHGDLTKLKKKQTKRIKQ